MKLTLTLNGEVNKKQLICDVSEIVGAAAKYQGPPSFGYRIGDFVVDRNGILYTDDADDNTAERVIEGLMDKGYEGEAEEELPGLWIGYPRKKISDAGIERLKKFLAAKEDIIKKALGIESVEIELDDEQVRFPWFTGKQDPEDVKAYTTFICALCRFAETQKRVTAQKQDVENGKYAFRCMLLRLGMIGDDTKEIRKRLMRRLEGSASFKSGKKKENAELPADEDNAAQGANTADSAKEENSND